jgi:hypothetical protein
VNPNQAVNAFAEKAEKAGLRFLQRSPGSVEVESEDGQGFPVGIFAETSGLLRVTGGDWHEEFKDFGEALDCISFLLSDACRLKTVYRGSTVASCSVQSCKNGVWHDELSVGFFLVAFWKTKRVEFKQNKAVNASG